MATNANMTPDFLPLPSDATLTLHSFLHQAASQSCPAPAPMRVDLPAMSLTTSLEDFELQISARLDDISAQGGESNFSLLTGMLEYTEEDYAEYLSRDVCPYVCPRRNSRNDWPPENGELMGRMIFATCPDDAPGVDTASLFADGGPAGSWGLLWPSALISQFHFIPLVVGFDSHPNTPADVEVADRRQLLLLPENGLITAQRCTFEDAANAVLAHGYKDLFQHELGVYEEALPARLHTELLPAGLKRWAAISKRKGRPVLRNSPPRVRSGSSHSVQQQAMLSQPAVRSGVDSILQQHSIGPASSVAMPGMADPNVAGTAQQAALEAMMSLRGDPPGIPPAYSASSDLTPSIHSFGQPQPPPAGSDVLEVMRQMQAQIAQLAAQQAAPPQQSTVPLRVTPPAASGTRSGAPSLPSLSSSGLSVGVKVNPSTYGKMKKALLAGTVALAADLYGKVTKKGYSKDGDHHSPLNAGRASEGL